MPMTFARRSLAGHLALWAVLASAKQAPGQEAPVLARNNVAIRAGTPVEDVPGETSLRNVRQLTTGGEHTEAHWSFDGQRLILQSKRPPHGGSQVFVLDLATGQQKRVSNGEGEATGGYFLQGDRRVLFASTHSANDSDIFTAKPDGSDLIRITDSPGIDRRASVCPVTGRITFESIRDGDSEIYSMEPDGSDVVRLTDRIGYDGEPSFSHDGTKIVSSSSFPADDEKHSGAQEITVMRRDGTGFRRITSNGRTNVAPSFHPDNQRIVFASDLGDTDGYARDLYMIDVDGENQVRLTFDSTSYSCPRFSPDGKYLAFTSNRFANKPLETNVFVAEWVGPASGPR